jgi:hypothetical protein
LVELLWLLEKHHSLTRGPMCHRHNNVFFHLPSLFLASHLLILSNRGPDGRTSSAGARQLGGCRTGVWWLDLTDQGRDCQSSPDRGAVDGARLPEFVQPGDGGRGATSEACRTRAHRPGRGTGARWMWRAGLGVPTGSHLQEVRRLELRLEGLWPVSAAPGA